MPRRTTTWAMRLKDQGNLDEAVACYRRALELKPGLCRGAQQPGRRLHGPGEAGRSGRLLPPGIGTEAGLCRGTQQPGQCLEDQGKLDEAVACYRRALELKPDYAEAHNNLGNAFKDQGKLDEAVACYRRALELKPDYAEAHSNLLFTLQYCTGVTPAALAEAHAEYDRRHAAPPPRRARPRTRTAAIAHGRLRLGFVSPDLGRHPVGYFLVRVLENLDQEQSRDGLLLRPDRQRRLDASSSSRRDPVARRVRHQRPAAGGADPRRTGSTSFSTWQGTRPTTGCWSSPASRRRSR